MDARFACSLIFFVGMAVDVSAQSMPGLSVGTGQRASFRTANFVAHADSREVARKVALTAEAYRQRLARLWLGKELPQWPRPCPIRVKVGTLGAGGATTFRFVNGTVRDWNMRVQGSLERVLDSVVPHEVNHTIFASHFRRPLPRWADEGAATLFEHSSERNRQLRLLEQVQRRGRRYSLRQLLTMMEYPEDMRHVLTLYAQGYSLVDFLIQQGGRHRFVRFLEDAGRADWETAIRKHYHHGGIDPLDANWNGWFLAGSPKLSTPGSSRGSVEVAVARQESRPEPAARTASAPVEAVRTAALRERPRPTVRAPEPEVSAFDERSGTTLVAVHRLLDRTRP